LKKIVQPIKQRFDNTEADRMSQYAAEPFLTSLAHMTRRRALTSVFVVVWLSGLVPQALAGPPPDDGAGMRTQIDLTDGWRFQYGDIEGASDVGFDDAEWLPISLPHTWNALDGQDGGGDYARGVGWYRVHTSLEGIAPGRQLFLRFDGANLIARVFVNGAFVGEHRGGYAGFVFDVTDRLTPAADNVIAVSVDNSYRDDVPPLSADYTFFGGLYRPVHVVATAPVLISPFDYGGPGVYVSTPRVDAGSADVNILVRVINRDAGPRTVGVTTTIYDPDGAEVQQITTDASVDTGAAIDVRHALVVTAPQLWDGINQPAIYHAAVRLDDDSGPLDSVDQTFGLRAYSVDPQAGLILNGRRLDVHGVNRHQDRLDRGWAIGPAEHREDLALIREMGANALRPSAYQQDQTVYDECDRTGLVVSTDIPLVNRITQSDAFAANAEQQLLELILQNYNHPSILFWGLYNEVTLEPGPDALQLVQHLAAVAHATDPGRLTTAASAADPTNPLNWVTDVIGFNKYLGWYEGSPRDIVPWLDDVEARYADRGIALSELGAGASIVQHEVPPTQPDPFGPWHPEEWQNLFHEVYTDALGQRPFFWGSFVWVMFDFAVDSRNEGDTPGRNDKGLITYDRQTKKDAFYWYQANWSATPVVYITSRRFVMREVSPVPVKVYSNADSVELFVNGVSQGRLASAGRRFEWSGVALLEGENEIRASATKDGVVYEDVCRWFYTP
jgi:beta-galactosidase